MRWGAAVWAVRLGLGQAWVLDNTAPRVNARVPDSNPMSATLTSCNLDNTPAMHRSHLAYAPQQICTDSTGYVPARLTHTCLAWYCTSSTPRHHPVIPTLTFTQTINLIHASQPASSLITLAHFPSSPPLQGISPSHTPPLSLTHNHTPTPHKHTAIP